MNDRNLSLTYVLSSLFCVIVRLCNVPICSQHPKLFLILFFSTHFVQVSFVCFGPALIFMIGYAKRKTINFGSDSGKRYQVILKLWYMYLFLFAFFEIVF